MTSIRTGIRELLAECPRSCDELAVDLGAKVGSVRSIISMLRDVSPRVIHVHSWVRNTNAAGVYYLRARYALGDKPDAEKPTGFTRAERNKRCQAKGARPVASVFDLGKRR